MFDAIGTMHLIAFILEKYLKLQMSNERQKKLNYKTSCKTPYFLIVKNKRMLILTHFLSSCRSNFHFCTGFHISLFFLLMVVKLVEKVGH